ncbi:MAG TPA: sigma factor-like helix-turn-helix DNA-binding protein [Acidimicrobiales bacterium]
MVTAPGAGAAGRGAGRDPSELAESLTFGFLRLLEALTPVERVVFVLADVFGVPFPEIAQAVDRSADACRQIASRARARVRDDERRRHAPDDAARVADDLVAALVRGDTEDVLSLLAPDVEMVSDGGPATHAARRPVVGRDRVSRLLVNLVRRGAGWGLRYEHTELNGDAGVVAPGGRLAGVRLGVHARRRSRPPDLHGGQPRHAGGTARRGLGRVAGVTVRPGVVRPRGGRASGHAGNRAGGRADGRRG